MKLLTTPPELDKEFKRLIKKYDEYYWATAWAGARSGVFTNLLTAKNKIKKIVVGIHFYQTHPDFIQEFLGNRKVRFIEQPEGIFHPKLYLFIDKKHNWELITGSANFTREAFTRNTEASILISSKDNNSNDIFTSAFELVRRVWTQGKVFEQDDLDRYCITWKNQRKKIKSLSGKYGSDESNAHPIHNIPTITRSWNDFMTEVREEPYNGLNKRLRVIEIVQALFPNHEHFSDMADDERKFIAGIPNKLRLRGSGKWGYFGSMKGAGIFKNRVITNDPNISLALDQIPQHGQITRQHYDNYIAFFKASFAGTRAESAVNLATATRLLCMKRPDVFVCIDNKNRGNLCTDFGIPQRDMSYERYWDDIVERIYDSEWWQHPREADDVERRVSAARAAFLDSLYYQ